MHVIPTKNSIKIYPQKFIELNDKVLSNIQTIFCKIRLQIL